MTARGRLGETGAIAFAERLLALLDEGSFTATYKYAVLLGLMDLCMEGVSATGLAPDVLTTRQLAEKVIQLYWPHAAPYDGLPRPDVLRQNTTGQAEIVAAVRKFGEALAADPLAPLHRARAADPKAYERLVRHVEWKLIEMPLPRLQVMGSGEDRFVYEIGWDRNIRSRRDVRRYQRGEADAFDNRILLKPGVAEYLVQLNGVVRPLVHRHWAARVAAINRLEEARLERFLFGAERTSLQQVGAALMDVEHGKCFYCGKSARAGAEVDHFIPWSRHPDDGLDNLVLADRRCNGYKRDFLAAGPHVKRWRDRMATVVPSLEETRWYRDERATVGVARAIYQRLPDGTPLWVEGKEFEGASVGGLGALLS